MDPGEAAPVAIGKTYGADFDDITAHHYLTAVSVFPAASNVIGLHPFQFGVVRSRVR